MNYHIFMSISSSVFFFRVLLFVDADRDIVESYQRLLMLTVIGSGNRRVGFGK